MHGSIRVTQCVVRGALRFLMFIIVFEVGHMIYAASIHLKWGLQMKA